MNPKRIVFFFAKIKDPPLPKQHVNQTVPTLNFQHNTANDFQLIIADKYGLDTTTQPEVPGKKGTHYE